jgi:hypothetical protein
MLALPLGHRSGVSVERIASRTDGANEIGTRPCIERLAQAPDVHIDSARVDIGIVTPDRFEESLAREDPSGVL